MPAGTLIVWLPAVALAALMASRKLQSALHTPSFVSAVLVTVNTASGTGGATLGAAAPWPSTTRLGNTNALVCSDNTATGAWFALTLALTL